jgi:hypothetical protein
MPLSNSIQRRYTPPTCTLEIAAKTSPLSQFVGKSVLKDLRFELRFDDPRQPDDHRITIRGDRTELEYLHDAVNRYVQDFLNSPSTQLPLYPGTRTAVTGTNKGEYSPQDSLAAKQLNPEFSKLENVEALPQLKLDPNRQSRHSTIPAPEIYLQPKGLLAHNLFLGQLANEESGEVVNLSVTQLFDLVTALDEYASEAVALPQTHALKWKQTPAWASTAAAVLVTVGVTTAAVKYFDRPAPQQQAVAPTATPQTPPPVAGVPPVPTTPISPLPTPAVPLPLSTASKLPPPSPVTPPPTPANLNLPNSDPGSSSSGNQRPTTVIPAPSAPIARAPKPSFPSPTSRRIATGSSPASRAAVPNSGATPSSQTAKSPPPVASRSPVSAAPPALNLPSLKPTAATDSNPARGDITASKPPDSSGESSLSESAATNNAQNDNRRLFDNNNPQVAQVRGYLQQRWNPPSGLTEPLEYVLFLTTDGSIERSIPIGNAAAKYIERTDISPVFPAPGKPFVNAVDRSSSPPIRVILYPDGRVETMPDNGNWRRSSSTSSP